MTELKKEIFDLAFAVYRVTDLFQREEALRRDFRECSNFLLRRTIKFEFARQDERKNLIREILSELEVTKGLIALSMSTGLMKAINADVLNRECLALEVYFEQEFRVVEEHNAKIEQNSEKTAINQKIQNDTTINDIGISVNDILKAQKQPIIKQALEKQSFPVQSIDRLGREADPTGINERQEAILGYLRKNREARMSDFVTIFSNRFSMKTIQRDLVRLITIGSVEKDGDKRWAVYRLNGDSH